MKKTLLILSSVVAVSLTALGQGYLNWSGIAGNFIGATNSTQYSTFVGGSQAGQSTGNGASGVTAGSASQLYYYQLLYTGYSGSQAAAPTTLVGLESWASVGSLFTATNSLASNGRIVQQNSSAGILTPGTWNNGTTNSILLVGWSANLGNSWANVQTALNTWSTGGYVANAFLGVSATGYINPTSASPGATIFNAASNSQGLPINSIASPAQLYLIAPVPEPSTLALAALSGASLLLFRRRK